MTTENKEFGDQKSEDLSPLRYPGAKKSLFPYINKLLFVNNLTPQTIVEPFVGGASITLHLLHYKIVKKAIISDVDRLIYSFWHVLFTKHKYLINFIENVSINVDNYLLYKEIANNHLKYSENKLAEACIYLNRTSFSGILNKCSGPIGGLSQKSKYDISCRFNKRNIIDKINKLSEFQGRITVLPFDWKETIRYVNELVAKGELSNNILYYFDPPFYNKANKLYRHFFQKEDHVLLSEAISSLKYPWVLSYDHCPEIKKMYLKNKTAHIHIPYSINSHSRRKEKEFVILPTSLSYVK